jgi:hypothetical protein
MRRIKQARTLTVSPNATVHNFRLSICRITVVPGVNNNHHVAGENHMFGVVPGVLLTCTVIGMRAPMGHMTRESAMPAREKKHSGLRIYEENKCGARETAPHNRNSRGHHIILENHMPSGIVAAPTCVHPRRIVLLRSSLLSSTLVRNLVTFCQLQITSNKKFEGKINDLSVRDCHKDGSWGCSQTPSLVWAVHWPHDRDLK